MYSLSLIKRSEYEFKICVVKPVLLIDSGNYLVPVYLSVCLSVSLSVLTVSVCLFSFIAKVSPSIFLYGWH